MNTCTAPGRWVGLSLLAGGARAGSVQLTVLHARPTPDAVDLGGRLHNSMRDHHFVSNAPWYGVSDDKGPRRIEGVPDGQAEVHVWHPDPLTDQAPWRVEVAAGTAAEARLNFTPLRRPPPRIAPKGRVRMSR